MKSRKKLFFIAKSTKHTKIDKNFFVYFVLFVVSASLFFLAPLNKISANVEDRLPLDRVLDELAKRVDRFERSLPDFITTETLTQESYKKDGKLVDKTVTISLLAGRQLRERNGDLVELSFKEIRQIQSINGKKVRATELKPNGTQVGGAFSSILLSHFATNDQRDYYFNLDPENKTVRGRPTYLLTFLSREDRKNQFYLFDEKSYESRQHGRAWIDAETLFPLRIEYNEVNLPKGIQTMFYAVDYASVELGDESFILPTEAFAEIDEGKKISRARHIYQNYKMFSTDVKVN